MHADLATSPASRASRVSRRRFLVLLSTAAGGSALAASLGAQSSDSTRRGSLGYPSVAGRPRTLRP